MVAAPTGAAAMGAIRMDVPDAPEVDRPEAGRAGATRLTGSAGPAAALPLISAAYPLENRHPTLLFPRRRDIHAGGSHSARPRFGPAEFLCLLDLPKELTQ